MRSFKLTALIITLLFGMIACKPNDTSVKPKDNYLMEEIVKTDLGEYQVYHNGHQGYSIQIPKDWIFKVKKNTVLVIQSPRESPTDYLESLDVVIVDGGFKQKKNGVTERNLFDFDGFYRNHIVDLAKSEFNLSLVDEGEKKIGEQLIKWASFKPNDSKKDLRIVKHFIADAHQVFILTADLKNETFPVLGPIFHEIAESFRLLSDNS